MGGGIAGCAAALTLSRGGLATVVVAPPEVRRDRPGESLSPAVPRLLRDLGIGDALAAIPHRKANAAYSSWGSPLLTRRGALPQREGTGYVVDRAAFDAMLWHEVAQTRAAIVPVRMTRAVRQNELWSMTAGDEFSARFVLDCSGRAAVIARALTTRDRSDNLVAAYAFLRPMNDAVEPTQAMLIEAVPQGWWYANLLPDGRLALALFADADTMPTAVARDPDAWRGAQAATTHVSRWLESAGFERDAPVRLASAATTTLTSICGPGWIAAGDAAAAFDPLSSHGIATALWSGRQAALAAASALSDDEGVMQGYAATVAGAVRDFHAQRGRIYAHERRFAKLPFWRRRGLA